MFISTLRNGKSPGEDELQPDVIKRRGRKLVDLLYTIIKDPCEKLEVTADWKEAQLQEGRRKIAETIPGSRFSLYQGKCLLVNLTLSTQVEDY